MYISIGFNNPAFYHDEALSLPKSKVNDIQASSFGVKGCLCH